MLYSKEQQAKDTQERNDWFLKVNGREYTFNDFLKSIGGRNLGQSQLTRERSNSRSSDDAVKGQT